MTEAALAILILGGFFVLRGILATVFFFYLLPDGIECPNCNSATVRVESRGWNFLLPRFRTSWCLACGWHGLLRDSPRAIHDDAYSLSHSGQLPESSKKSSK
jgi:hypothetical protein